QALTLLRAAHPSLQKDEYYRTDHVLPAPDISRATYTAPALACSSRMLPALLSGAPEEPMKFFKTIRDRAAQRKGGEHVLESLLGPRPDNSALAALADHRVLSTIANRIFCAGFAWSA